MDFIVVTEREVSDEQVAALQAMHERLYELETPWAQHLEGSYLPKKLLRRVDSTRAPLLYFDNGSTVPERDNHCNTAVVRWSLREHGVVLAGPDPKTLIDAVSARDLRDEVRSSMAEWVDYASTPTKAGGMSQRLQTFIVLSFCRILETLESGRVTLEEGGRRVGPRCARSGVEGSHPAGPGRPAGSMGAGPRPAAPEAVAQTHAFIDYALRKGTPARPLDECEQLEHRRPAG